MQAPTQARCVDSVPSQDGRYCVVIDGMRSMLPIYMNVVDGQWCWNNIGTFVALQGREAVYWFPEEGK